MPTRATARKTPPTAKTAPFVELLAPLKRIEPDAVQGHEQRLITIDADHSDNPPAKKRDMRKRGNRKRIPYKSTGTPMGHPSFMPTPEQRKLVVVLVGMTVPQKTIASLIGEKGITENTLVKHFRRELDIGKEHFIANLKALVVLSAQSGSVRAQTYLLDRLGGPEFAPRMRLSADVDPPITINADARVTIFLPDNGRKANG